MQSAAVSCISWEENKDASRRFWGRLSCRSTWASAHTAGPLAVAMHISTDGREQPHGGALGQPPPPSLLFCRHCCIRFLSWRQPNQKPVSRDGHSPPWDSSLWLKGWVGLLCQIAAESHYFGLIRWTRAEHMTLKDSLGQVNQLCSWIWAKRHSAGFLNRKILRL